MTIPLLLTLSGTVVLSVSETPVSETLSKDDISAESGSTIMGRSQNDLQCVRTF